MKTLIISAALLSSTLVFSQVGIDTTNPQAKFHVDGAKDNPSTGVPNVAQQGNDFVVTSAGNVGIGTTVPANKLTVTGGKFQYTDGTEQQNYVLTSDASGVASWQMIHPFGESTSVHMAGTQTFNSAAAAGGAIQPTLFDPAVTPNVVGANTIGVTFPTNSEVHLPQGRYLVFVQEDIAGNEFAAFSAWVMSNNYRVYYAYYGNFVAGPCFIADFRNSPTGDSLSFKLLGLTNNPSPTFYNASYTNTNWQINLTILKLD
ncbi:hypothetical protein [Chryseobacterium sp.]|jgi:hypothetical protein|uniref:hypothetical protein n=1 Tax=Chryseobacterium sp. TaxID=1871047 RepID=UPI0028414801|nr:hypothetical protein [Chryseobacterium sp.]MDR3023080.1 hypothetical protein [Chryseobacterium sp.]